VYRCTSAKVLCPVTAIISCAVVPMIYFLSFSNIGIKITYHLSLDE
jgi:hypothetical protein